MFAKAYSIPLSKTFQIINPTYAFLKLTPSTSTRNYNSSIIAKSVALTYKNNMFQLFNSIKKYIRKEEEKVFYKAPSKISYYIYIEKNKVEFYIIVPSVHLSLIKEKVGDVWKEITIKQVDSIPLLDSDKSLYYQLHYAKEDALSLKTDKRSNYLLSSQLNVLDFMEEIDKLSITYNLMPVSQNGWKSKYKETISKFYNRQPLEKEKVSEVYLAKKFLSIVYDIIDTVIETFLDLMGDNSPSNKNQTALELALGLDKRQLSTSTTKKNEAIILNTQIVVGSQSPDPLRIKNNILSVCQGFDSITDDNTLTYKELKNFNNNMTDYRFKKVIENKMSTDELQNFISLPGRDILDRFSFIEKTNILEKPVPEELQKGYISIGKNVMKGVLTTAYLSSNKDMANLGLTIIGPQGAGKSEYLKNYANNVLQRNENIIVIDFIKNCELSTSIKSITPKEKLIELNLDDPSHFQGFGYNEITFKKNMNAYELLEMANMQAQQNMALIDAINSDGSPLSSRMRRYLSAAANIVHLKQNSSLRDVIDVLSNFKIRGQTINAIPKNLRNFLVDEIQSLSELDEVKEIKDKSKEPTVIVTGTKDSKIEYILDRINLLKEDFKLKFMFNKSIENNINFATELDKGKVILIKIPEHKYPLPYVKNVLVTYFISKIWIASQIRGYKHQKPLRTHVILDEIYQAPTSQKLLLDILPQSRKFQTKFVISAHYLSQIEKIQESLKASGSSYMLLQGSDKNVFNALKSELAPYELEDFLNLKRFQSLNLITTSKGYSSFVSNLPAPLK